MDSSTTAIEDLPPEMINELFNHLPLKDLLACSMVNKRWHSIYSKFKLNSMAAIYSLELSPWKWYETGNIMEDKEICLPDFFCDIVEKPIVSNLRYLALFANFAFRMDLNKLNRFSQLLHLEFDSYFRWLNKGKLHLNFPQLKVLAFHEYNGRSPVSVDCPKLDLLLYRGEPEGSNLLEVKQPETIRKLETDMFGEKLTPFKNVECLVTRRLQVIDKSTLLSLPKLRELHFKLEVRYSEFFGAQEQLKKFLSDVRLFQASRSFRFQLAGFDLSQEKLDRMDFSVPVVEEIEWRSVWECTQFCLNNIDLIDPSEPVELIHPVNYTALMRHFDGRLPNCFFQKFKGIEEVRADKIEDVDHFLSFLKSLSLLRKLRLKKTRLGQEFYDYLPTLAPSLYILELREHGETGLNFAFLNNLSHLTCLEIDFIGASPLQSMSSLFGAVGKSLWADICYYRINEETSFCVFEKSRDSIMWIMWSARSKDSSIDAIRSIERFKTKKLEELLDFFERVKLGSLDSRSKEKNHVKPAES